MTALSATALKNVLWDTLKDIKDDRMLPSQGDAIATQAREILRTIKVQLQIAGQTKRSVPADVLDFAERPTVLETSPRRRRLAAPREGSKPNGRDAKRLGAKHESPAR